MNLLYISSVFHQPSEDRTHEQQYASMLQRRRKESNIQLETSLATTAHWGSTPKNKHYVESIPEIMQKLEVAGLQTVPLVRITNQNQPE